MSSLILLSTLILTWVGTPTRGLFEQNSARERLIYEFAINYKQISRLSLLSCHKAGYKITSQKQTTLREPVPTTTVDAVKMLHSLVLAAGVLIKVAPIEEASGRPGPSANTVTISKGMLRMLRNEDFRQVIVLDLSCGNSSLQILQLASDKGLFNSSYHWLLMEDYNVSRGRKKHGDGLNPALIEFLAGLDINMNTEVTLARRIDLDQDQVDYLLFDVWNPGWQFGGKLNVTEVGRFSQCNGLQMYDWFSRTTTIVRRMDMKNVPIRCMIVVTNKFSGLLEDYLRSHRDTHLDSMHRFNFALLSHVRDMFNFSFQLYRTNSWGYLRNNTFDGMIGALIRKEVDIGGSPAFFRIERAKVVDSTVTTWKARPCFIFRHPDQSSVGGVIFLRPFSNGVWVSVAVFGLVIIILLWKTGSTERNVLDETGRHCNKSIEKIPKHSVVFSSRPGGLVLPEKIPWKTPKGKTFLATTVDIEGATATAVAGCGRENNRHRTNRGVETVKTVSKVKTSGGFLRDISRWSFKRSFSHHKSKLSIQGYWSSISAVGKTNYNRSRNNSMIPGASEPGERTTQAQVPCPRGVISCDKERPGDELHVGKERRNRSKDTQKKWSHLSRWNFNKDSQTTSSFLQDCILFFIGSLCQQGTLLQTTLLASRCIIFSTLLLSFCINQFYSASIVGTLLMERPKTIKTLRDLIDSSLRVAIEDIPYNRDYFQIFSSSKGCTNVYCLKEKSSDPDFSQPHEYLRGWRGMGRTTDPDVIELYWRKVDPHPEDIATAGARGRGSNYSGYVSGKSLFGPSSTSASTTWRKTTKNVSSSWCSPEEGLKLMKAGGYAFHVDVGTVYKIITEAFTEKEICELTEIQLFPPEKMVNIVQKGSPLRKVITYGLRRTSETGLMDRQRRVWHSQKPRCVKQIQPNDLRVGMQTFTSAVFILIFGVAASIVILALEVMHDLWAKSSVSKTKTRNN